MRRAGWRAGAVAMVVAIGGGMPLGWAQDAVIEDDMLIIHDFEHGLHEWGIPDWERTNEFYGAGELATSKDFASHGTSSMMLTADLPGAGTWTGAYAEIEMHVTDWTPYAALAVDVYVPYNAPVGLQSRLILTVGEQWTWTEMNRGILLPPGQWTTITAKLVPGSMDWKFFPDDAFRKDIRKIGVRIESDKGPTYRGPVFIDNVRLLLK